MSRIYTIVILALLSVAICESANLTAITWKHDINKASLLEETLKKNDVKAITVKVVLGQHKKDQKPSIKTAVIQQKDNDYTSDFSLLEFLIQTIEHHNKNKQNTKIIQLNLFSLESAHGAIDILLKKHREINFPIWLNADILNGPGANDWHSQIDGKQFIEEVKRMHNVVLSIGWKTNSPGKEGEEYTKKNIEDMEKILKESQIQSDDNKDITINFPIHAIYAIKGKEVLKEFYGKIKPNPVTYTIRSMEGDKVNATELREFIVSYGVDHVYIDLPENLERDVKLPLPNGASSIVQFGLLNVITLVVVAIFRN